MTDKTDLAERILISVKHFNTLLQMYSNDSIPGRIAPEKWSPREIIGHLIDSAINNYRRFLLSAANNTLVFTGYEQTSWVNLVNYEGMEWSEIINLWVHLNKHISRLINNMPLSVLLDKYEVHNLDEVGFNKFPRNESASLSQFIEDYLDHIHHHMSQVESLLAEIDHL